MKTKVNGSAIPSATPMLMDTMEDYLGGLLTGRCLLLAAGRGWALELPEDRREPLPHSQLDPGHLPFLELDFETVLVQIPAGFDREQTRDTLSEAARIARKRILILGRVVPVDAEGYFQSHRGFQLVWPHLLQLTDVLVEALIFSVFEVGS